MNDEVREGKRCVIFNQLLENGHGGFVILSFLVVVEGKLCFFFIKQQQRRITTTNRHCIFFRVFCTFFLLFLQIIAVIFSIEDVCREERG